MGKLATGGVNVFRRLPYPDNPQGEEWYLLNMYTLPDYRGSSLGRAITQAAIDYAKAQGIYRIWLNATDAGRSVYQQAGFVPVEGASEMVYIVA